MSKNLLTMTGVLGLVLGCIALATALLFPARALLNAVLAVCSLALLLVFFVRHFEAFRAFSRQRSTQFGLNSVLMAALFVFIVVIFNLMARQYYFRFDLSSTTTYSLAPQTAGVVRGLDRVVDITVFGQGTGPSLKKAAELLEGYRYLNRNIVYTVLDLDSAPLLAKEYGVNQYDTVVVRAGDGSVVAQGVNEQAITNAVIRATRSARKRIFFVTGHGERDLKNSGRDGMTKAVAGLQAIGYETAPLTLAAVEAVPGDADILVIAGPREKFTSADARKIERFLERGGKLLALFDPGYDAAGLSAVTVRAGVRVREGMIVDPRSNLGGKDEKVPLVSEYPETPITRDFKLSTVYPGVAPLSIGGSSRTHEYFTVVTASPGARVAQGGGQAPEAGPLIIAAAAGSKAGRDILLVFGDSDFASNAFYDVAGNGNLLLNCVNWMAGEAELISITPRKDDYVPLYLTPEQGAAVLYFCVGAVPLAVFGPGLFLWARRRRL